MSDSDWQKIVRLQESLAVQQVTSRRLSRACLDRGAKIAELEAENEHHLLHIRNMEAENERLRKRCGDLWRDVAEWLQLAKRQYDEMPHNSPLCPTLAGIEKSVRLLVPSKALESGEADDA